MKDKLKPNMYVRTKRGYIYKLGYYEEDDNRWISFEENDWYPVYESSVTKASHNIIDLIEVGDYVNGFPVIHKENDILKCGLLVQFKENEIKSIVTKEMFANAEYKVETN